MRKKDRPPWLQKRERKIFGSAQKREREMWFGSQEVSTCQKTKTAAKVINSMKFKGNASGREQ